MTHESWQQEQLSLAYVRAVAAVAGYAAQRPEIDYDGIDLTFHAHGGGGVVRSPRLDAQVKSETSGAPATFPWKYALKVENYEKLRHEDYATARILIVVAMPADVGDWVKQSAQQLVVRHCAYWVSLRGQPPTTNASTITVALPGKQKFSPAALRQIMMRLGHGQML